MINARRPAAILIARFTARRRHTDAPLATSLPARGDPRPDPPLPSPSDLDLEIELDERARPRASVVSDR